MRSIARESRVCPDKKISCGRKVTVRQSGMRRRDNFAGQWTRTSSPRANRKLAEEEKAKHRRDGEQRAASDPVQLQIRKGRALII